MNIYIAFLCKECERWVSCSKRDFPNGLDVKYIVKELRKISCQCPVCKKNIKLYNKNISNYNSKFIPFVNAEECSDFVKNKNGLRKSTDFFSYHISEKTLSFRAEMNRN